MAEKHYPTDPLGQVDAGMGRETRWPKPCCKRIDHDNEVAGGVVTWCALAEGHQGQCSGPPPRLLESSPYAAQRLVGLKRDVFADVIEAQRAKAGG